jgi:hypothetical protein
MDHKNPAGEQGVCMKVMANRAGMLWLAYRLMDLAHCSEEAAESGVHIHLESLATPPVMSWKHTLVLERLPDHER